MAERRHGGSYESELSRETLMAVVDKIYWYDGELEVLVKGEEFLEASTLHQITAE